MPRALLILSAICALAIAGCAQGGDTAKDSTANYKGTEKLIAGTVEDLQAYGEKGEGQRICSQLLTARLSQKIGRQGGAKGCTGAVTAGMDQTDKADLEVTDVAIDPKDPAKATATVKA
ncbi:MAG: hypothetical protein ACKOQ0_02565, partial [Solirubrobacterales bacterium]